MLNEVRGAKARLELLMASIYRDLGFDGEAKDCADAAMVSAIVTGHDDEAAGLPR